MMTPSLARHHYQKKNLTAVTSDSVDKFGIFFHKTNRVNLVAISFFLLMLDANITGFRGVKLSKYFKLFPQKMEDGVDISWL